MIKKKVFTNRLKNQIQINPKNYVKITSKKELKISHNFEKTITNKTKNITVNPKFFQNIFHLIQLILFENLV